MEYTLIYYGIKAFIDHHNARVATSRDALNIPPIHYCTSLTLEYLFYRPYAVDATRFISNMTRIHTHCIIEDDPLFDDDTCSALTLNINLRKFVDGDGNQYYFDRSDGYVAFRFLAFDTEYQKLGFETLLQIIFNDDWSGFDSEFDWILDDLCNESDFHIENHKFKQFYISNIHGAMIRATDEWLRDARIS